MWKNWGLRALENFLGGFYAHFKLNRTKTLMLRIYHGFAKIAKIENLVLRGSVTPESVELR